MNELPQPVRHHELLSAARSRVLVVDVQEKLLPVIAGNERMLKRCERLLRAAEILGVPCSATEQYPRGLGPAVESVRSFFGEIPDKSRFSGVECLPWARPGADDGGRDQVVVAGIESHVCVLQTAFDLAAQGFRVYIAADAVGSRFAEDKEIALRRMEASGISLVTSEAVLFEWCESAETERFKAISGLVKEG